MKKAIEQLIDQLADKSMTFGQQIYLKRRHSKGVRKIRSDFSPQGKNYCQECRKGKIYGSGFTNYKCGYCKKSYSHGNTGVPAYCDPCADKHGKCRYCKCEIKILGHPVLIGDVLKKMTGRLIDNPSLANEILGLWCNVGFTKSLQQILEEVEWVEVQCDCVGSGISPCFMCEQYGSKTQTRLIPKQPTHHNLFEFLLTFPTMTKDQKVECNHEWVVDNVLCIYVQCRIYKCIHCSIQKCVKEDLRFVTTKAMKTIIPKDDGFFEDFI